MGRCAIYFRPEGALLGADARQNSLLGTISLRTFRGSTIEYVVDTPVGEFIVYDDGDHSYAEGDNAYLSVPPQKARHHAPPGRLPMTTLPVLLDVDTGYDDALALLLALRSPQLRVLGITCVAGNQRLPQVVNNTLKLLDILEVTTPVAAGMDRPLLEPMRTPLALHGSDGMADLELPPPQQALQPVHAVEFLRRTLADAPEPVTLICLAPLTNIAVLLRMAPAVRDKIGQIVVMGGTLLDHGNTSPLAEFNIRHDPEAAAIVLESGLPIRLYPLDVFRAVRCGRVEIDALLAGADPAAQTAGRILDFACSYFQRPDALIGDAGTVATVIDPTACTVERYPVHVELAGAATRGMTVLDRRQPGQRARSTDWWEADAHEIEVIAALDADYYRDLLCDTLLKNRALS